MALFGRRDKVALGFGAERVRLFVGRGNGRVQQLFADARELPAGALRVGLRGPVVADREAVVGALQELLGAARSEGLLARAPESVALLVADGTFKMALAPLAGDPPRRADGDRMARWLLRDLVPVPEAEIRASWSVLDADDSQSGGRQMLSIGGVAVVIDEYEALVAELGWSVGRLVPWSFAAAAASRGPDSAPAEPQRDLVLCDADGTLGALFQAGGLPRLHRAWRAPVAGAGVGAELPALQRYVNDHLETTIARVWLCGSAEWTGPAQEACSRAGLAVQALTPEAALCAAVEG
jgi:hypothetical protein